MSATTKKIYSEYATFDAVDHDRQIAGQLNLQVLPGPATRIVPICGVPRSIPNAQIALIVQAWDQYGNNATNVPPPGVDDTLPLGYEGVADVTSSDPQAVTGTATITADPNRPLGPNAFITLRTAGPSENNAVWFTARDNPDMQRGQCNIAVDGPEALNGRIHMADPFSTGNTVVSLPAFRFLPPNDSSYTVKITSGPQVSVPNGEFRAARHSHTRQWEIAGRDLGT